MKYTQVNTPNLLKKFTFLDTPHENGYIVLVDLKFLQANLVNLDIP